MNRTVASLTLVLISAVTNTADACSFSPGYEFIPSFVESTESSAGSDAPPKLRVLSIDRGYFDGNIGSCSDAGILIIELEEVPPARGAFLFEVIDGAFPDAVIPDVPIRPIELANGLPGFMFVWLDLPAGQSSPQPFDVTLAISQFSALGQRSQPAYLRIAHSGEGASGSFAIGLAALLLGGIFLLGVTVVVLGYARINQRWQV